MCLDNPVPLCEWGHGSSKCMQCVLSINVLIIANAMDRWNSHPPQTLLAVSETGIATGGEVYQ